MECIPETSGLRIVLGIPQARDHYDVSKFTLLFYIFEEEQSDFIVRNLYRVYRWQRGIIKAIFKRLRQQIFQRKNNLWRGVYNVANEDTWFRIFDICLFRELQPSTWKEISTLRCGIFLWRDFSVVKKKMWNFCFGRSTKSYRMIYLNGRILPLVCPPYDDRLCTSLNPPL